jgi:predicted RNA methylase
MSTETDSSYLHLTYGLPMINDIVRNKFYNTILQDVKGKTCLEIGFGSGILSILALEHGANSIVAYEEMEDTYNLGVKIINSLGLQDKITLISERFTADKIDQHPNIDCIFTETINHTLWGESLLNVINGLLPEIIPNNYFLEVHAVEVNDNYAKRLLTNDNSICNPGIAINQQFSKTINEILNKKEIELTDGLHGLTLTNLNQVLDVCNIHNRLPEESYNININNPVSLETKIDWSVELKSGKNYLLVFRTGMQYKEHKLYTDVCDNWGPFAQYAVVINADSAVRIQQNFNDGNFILSYNNQQIHLIKKESAHNYNITETEDIKVINFEH